MAITLTEQNKFCDLCSPFIRDRGFTSSGWTVQVEDRQVYRFWRTSRAMTVYVDFDVDRIRVWEKTTSFKRQRAIMYSDGEKDILLRLSGAISYVSAVGRARKKPEPGENFPGEQAKLAKLSIAASKLYARIRAGDFYEVGSRLPKCMEELIEAKLVATLGRPKVIVKCYVPKDAQPYEPEYWKGYSEPPLLRPTKHVPKTIRELAEEFATLFTGKLVRRNGMWCYVIPSNSVPQSERVTALYGLRWEVCGDEDGNTVMQRAGSCDITVYTSWGRPKGRTVVIRNGAVVMKDNGKHPVLAGFLDEVFGRGKAVKGGTCSGCGNPAPPESFTTERALKEFTLSGLCQTCQNRVFTSTGGR